jgi:hypothetical protein
MRQLATGIAILLLLAGCRGGGASPASPLIKSQPQLTNGNNVISVGGGNLGASSVAKTVPKPSTATPGAATATANSNSSDAMLAEEDEATEALAATDATAAADMTAAL